MYSSTPDENTSNPTHLSNLGLFKSTRGRAGLASGGLVLALVFVVGKGWWRSRTFEDEAVARIKEAVAQRYNQTEREECQTAGCRAQLTLLQSSEVQVALYDKPSAFRLGIPILSVDVPFYYLVKEKDGEGVAVMAPPEDRERRRRRNGTRRRARDWRVRKLQLDGE